MDEARSESLLKRVAVQAKGTPAGDAADRALAEVQLAERIETFLVTIAGMKQDGEPGDGDEADEFVMENDDAVDTMNRLIGMARELVADLQKARG